MEGKEILVTGGAGYIGSHVAAELLKEGWRVVIVDNLSNSREETLERIYAAAGKKPVFHRGDITRNEELVSVFERHSFWAVIHLAGLKSVEDSGADPLEYFHTNTAGTCTLLRIMKQYGVRRIVYSSSATVYGDTSCRLIPVTQPRMPTSPYGDSKEFSERILERLQAAEKNWAVAVLRYFNPGGANPLLGEAPLGEPRNLLPVLVEVTGRRREVLLLFGDDYPTRDGTCTRDYIHISDLVRGHLGALNKVEQSGLWTYNLGTGTGTTVLEMAACFSAATGREIPIKVMPRRCGDVPVLVADPKDARSGLGWMAEKTIHDICADLTGQSSL